ncbi:unnamed protein product [Plutella xylostella]|uniref:Elongator complex protein 4 n=1 Tax=Plutella xylostella TaxID=51655 RepID=A0A8S4D5P2_PLUXY|nr:unnamed protein product [Plutella xylostella]
MTSFHKAIGVSINGTKVKNNLPIISTGIPSLDHIIGGGLPASSIFLVEEDVLGNYCRVLSKYFLAEGIVCQHALFIASCDEDSREFVKELPIPTTAPPAEEPGPPSEGIDKMKIAWRYESLRPVESSFGATSNFGHHFDLSKHVDAETIKNSNITYWNPSDNQQLKSGFNNNLYHDLLVNIKNLVSKEEYQIGGKSKKNILRISIQSLGSPVWTADDSGDDTSVYRKDLQKFMYCLRVILRDTTAVAYITMPMHLFDDISLTNSLLYSVDNAVRLESFAGSSRETNPVFKDYNGLFHVTKLSTINSLVHFVPPSLDMAFKLRRKKFNIEKLHLPPELEESSEREQDDITATPKVTCGGFKKKDIDF